MISLVRKAVPGIVHQKHIGFTGSRKEGLKVCSDMSFVAIKDYLCFEVAYIGCLEDSCQFLKVVADPRQRRQRVILPNTDQDRMSGNQRSPLPGKRQEAIVQG